MLVSCRDVCDTAMLGSESHSQKRKDKKHATLRLEVHVMAGMEILTKIIGLASVLVSYPSGFKRSNE